MGTAGCGRQNDLTLFARVPRRSRFFSPFRLINVFCKGSEKLSLQNFFSTHIKKDAFGESYFTESRGRGVGTEWG